MLHAKCSIGEALALVCHGPLWRLFLVLAIEILGASLSVPVFAFFCIEELHLRAVDVGILASCFNAAQLVGGPVVGGISDAVGRRPVLLMCFAWSSAGFAATYFVTGFRDLIAIRMLAGLSGGSIGVAAAMVMDCTRPDERPRILGFKGFLLGTILSVGPLFVACLLWMEFARRAIFLFSSAACLLGCIVGTFILRETHMRGSQRRFHTLRLDQRLQAVIASCYDVRLGMICAWSARFCMTCSTWCMYVAYAFLIKKYFGWGDVDLAILMSLASVFQGMLEFFLFPIVSMRLGEHGVCIAGSLVMAVSLALVVVPQVFVHVVGFMTFQLGQSFSQPGITNLTALHAPSEAAMGLVQGISCFSKSLASVTAPLLAGWLYDVTPLWTYALAAVVSLLGALTVLVAQLYDPTSEKVALLQAGELKLEEQR